MLGLFCVTYCNAQLQICKKRFMQNIRPKFYGFEMIKDGKVNSICINHVDFEKKILYILCLILNLNDKKIFGFPMFLEGKLIIKFVE